MKDVVGNRVRIGAREKVRLLQLSLKENGIVWTTLTGAYYVCSALADKAFNQADRVRKRNSLPGMNSVSMNKLIWESWDWSGRGEEWTLSEEWKRSVIERFLKPNIPEGAVVLEIGPGAGRWTAVLQQRAKKLTAVDVSEKCVRECRARFANCENVEFLVGNGLDLAAISTSSIEAIWSFDVFVHINRPEFQSYVHEAARVLKPGGVGVIHHGCVGGAAGGWRSNVTEDDVRAFLMAADLELLDQIHSWQDAGREFEAGLYDDAITTFRKRPLESPRVSS